MCLTEFVAPKYSRIARTAVLQGTVVVKVKVHACGEISEIWPPGTVVGPSGDAQLTPDPIKGMLEGSSVDAVKKWRFCPGPEAREFDITFVFKLTEPGVEGWAPNGVSFHSPSTVEISTARNSQIMTGSTVKWTRMVRWARSWALLPFVGGPEYDGRVWPQAIHWRRFTCKELLCVFPGFAHAQRLNPPQPASLRLFLAVSKSFSTRMASLHS
jgi:Gram-negative bacterial TonB protein C-terminal